MIHQNDGTSCLSLASLDMSEQSKAATSHDATVGRLVLSCDRRAAGAACGKRVSMYYACNGMVIDARTWRVLSLPPSAFNQSPASKIINPFLAGNMYDIIRVDDGTVVTLYNWLHPVDGSVWALASSNGYDVSSLRWIGNLTYAEVFYDLAKRLYPAFVMDTGMSLAPTAEGAVRLAFTSLDTARCYTVGFRHHNFHPLMCDPERMWQIQCTNLQTMETTFNPSSGEGLPGVPGQNVYANWAELAREFSPGIAPPLQLTLEGLRGFGKNAFEQAVAYIASPNPHSLTRKLNYGLILRSRDPSQTGAYSDLLVETPLLARIRKIVYERAPRTVRDNLSAEDRLEYNAMRAFLTAHEREDFLALYPQWTKRFQTYEEFVNNVVHLVIHATRQRAMAPTSREPPLTSATGQVAKALLVHICRYEKLAAFHKDTVSIVRDYVVNPEYAFLYLHAMGNTGSTEAVSAGK